MKDYIGNAVPTLGGLKDKPRRGKSDFGLLEPNNILVKRSLGEELRKSGPSPGRSRSVEL